MLAAAGRFEGCQLDPRHWRGASLFHSAAGEACSQGAAARAHSPISARAREVLGLMAERRSNAAIADALAITQSRST